MLLVYAGRNLSQNETDYKGILGGQVHLYVSAEFSSQYMLFGIKSYLAIVA
jgi:hypothetical protein